VDVDDMAGAHTGHRPSYWGNHYMAVPRDLVADIVEVLCEHLALFEWAQGTPAEVHAYYRLMAGTATALGGLLATRAASERHAGAGALLALVQDFLEHPQANEHLEALRDQRDVDGDVVAGLQALHRPIQRRRVEQTVKQRLDQAGEAGNNGGAVESSTSSSIPAPY
jgi:hypothetical protein